MRQTEEDTFYHFEHFKNGIEEGFNFFYGRYFKSLSRFGQKLLTNTLVVEEILNDAFLASWELKHLIECPRHLYCFTRLRVKWGCYEYCRKEKKEGLVAVEDIDAWLADDTGAHYLLEDNKELADIIYRVIPLLPPTKATIIKLYFRYGLSCKQIARHYESSSRQVSQQLHSGIACLKSLIKKKKHPGNFRIVSAHTLSGLSTASAEKLRADQLLLFKMRYEEKFSFEMIAQKLGMELHEVQQKYVEAHRLLRSLKTPKKLSYG